MPLIFGSLFAGIGGFDLGFERAGLTCSWQVEIDPFCQRVLAKHWPSVRRHDDVRTFPPEPTEEWNVDVICGGFPCQDISNAGKRAGIEGQKSGLWSEFVRIVRQLRPRYVVVENTASLAVRGLGRVLGDLSSLGFDAEWSVVSACALGAPHTRERLFVVAYAGSGPGFDGQRSWLELPQGGDEAWNFREVWLQPEPCRVAHGTPRLVDRLAGVGDSLVPQIAELIGRRLLYEVSHELPASARLDGHIGQGVG